jgi:protein-tyrosine phosphatase
MSYAEIHFHLLPGIDDGPSSIEESVALAAAAAAEGTRTIVVTPHVHPRFVTDTGVLADRVQELRAALAAARVEVDIECGGELTHEMVSRLSDSALDVIAHGSPGRRWLLLEAPLRGLYDGYTAAADELRERGFAVVVAHPERALASGVAAWRAIEHELAAGSALQLNAWSVAGGYGEDIQSAALKMLRRAPRAAIASDAHGGARMPALRLALDALKTVGIADPHRFVATEPYRLLRDGLSVCDRSALAA